MNQKTEEPRQRCDICNQEVQKVSIDIMISHTSGHDRGDNDVETMQPIDLDTRHDQDYVVTCESCAALTKRLWYEFLDSLDGTDRSIRAPQLLDNMKKPGSERNAIERADVMAKLIGIVTGQMGVVTKCVWMNDKPTPDSEVEHQVDLDVESMGFLYNVRINVNRFSTPEIEAQCRREDAENSNEPAFRDLTPRPFNGEND